jgi:uncharacterized protein involved in exopolysaccharide biosynthesis
MPLDLDARFADPDAAYRAIVEAHRGLSDQDSAALNAALVLILSNQIGDQAVLAEALELAKASLNPSGPAASR